MKTIKKVSILFILLSVFVVNAQSFQGEAYYQTKRNFDFKVERDSTNTKKESMINDDMRNQLKEMLRKQFEKTYVLTFNKNESIYKQEKELQKPTPTSSGITIEIGGGSDVLYINTKNKTFTKSQEDFGKKFLIKDKIIPLKWEMTKETKMIGKYLCIKAKAIKLVDDYDDKHVKKEKQKELEVIAWYTPEIPVSHGPEMFGGLPGLILELHQDKMHYVCNKIVMNPSEKIEIKAPKKGKEMNQKDFDNLMEKKQKEMMKNFRDGGRKKGNNSNTIMFSVGG